VKDELQAVGAAPPASDRIVTLGRIGGTFGVQGWVKVQSFTDPPGNILTYEGLQLQRHGVWIPVEIEQGRCTSRGVLIKLAGVDSPEEAQRYRGAELGVRRSDMPPPAPGEYYWSDLEGLEAFTPAGELLGSVDHFEMLPAHPMMVVRGEREHLVPFVKERIVRIDLTGRRIVLDWGLDW
jgi:16S rRNA processing protein RimM